VQKWLDLLTPSAAALSLLLAIALVVQAIRHGRAVRRLESRLAEREGAAARVSLDRLSQLSHRSGTSTGMLAPKRKREGPQLPRLGNLAAIAAVIALVLGTSWYLFIRDDGSGSAATSTTQTRSTATGSGTTTQAPEPVGAANDQVPANPAPLPQSKGAYTVLVLNGSGVQGAARNMLPLVQAAGYNTANPDNASTSDEKTSFVMYLPDKQDVADNVAHDLGIKRRVPLDGVSVTQDTQDVDAIVIVGLDLARRSSP
jgi:hypothetical protein